MFKTICKVTFAAGLLLYPLLSMAQQAKKPSNSLLPDINPQDIEIKGNFKATFPGLRRQPILGFNPTSPIFQMNKNHVPYMESPDQAVANISISKLESPIAPQKHYFTYPKSSSLYSMLGWGTDMSPQLKAYGEFHSNQETTVLAKVNFESSNGHYANQADSYRNFNFNVNWLHKLSKESRLGFGVEGMNNFNYRPGYAQKTEYGNVGLQAGFEHLKNEFDEFKAHINYHYFRYLPKVTNVQSSEHVIDLTLHKTWTGPAMNSNFIANLNTQSSIYTNPILTNENWDIVNPEIGYRVRKGYSHRITLKVDGFYAKDQSAGKFFAYPDLTYEFWKGTNFKFTANVNGKVFNPGMQGRYLQDEMLVTQMNPLNERVLTGRAHAQLTFFKGLQFSGGFRYQKYYMFQYVSRNPLGQYRLSQDTNTRMWRAYLGLSYDVIANKVAFTSKFYLQNQQLSNGNDVPFMENSGITTELSVNPVSKLNFKLWANYIGKRPKSTSGDLNAAILLGGHIEYRFTQHIGVYISGNNLLNRQYVMWPNYKEMPLRIFGGITLTR